VKKEKRKRSVMDIALVQREKQTTEIVQRERKRESYRERRKSGTKLMDTLKKGKTEVT
jgi:hypothetical protein